MAKKQEKGGRFLVSHALCFWHNTFKDCAPDDKGDCEKKSVNKILL